MTTTGGMTAADQPSADGAARSPIRPPRRGRLVSRIELHVAATSPLFALLAWRLWERPWFWLFLVLAGLGLLLIVLLLLGARLQQPDPFEFDEIVDLGDQVAGHVVGYLLPFLVQPSASEAEVWLTIGVLLVLGLILVQSNRVHLNPLLYLVGYRVYSAVTRGKSYYLVARSDLSRLDEPLLAAEVPGGLLVERKPRA
ncbi:MAG: hypothetical protein M3O70_27680 [Actinomycetota bacterium]|nr:hypothetical protein [Actinomycetota bacterium]